jgi:hypothetical protein
MKRPQPAFKCGLLMLAERRPFPFGFALCENSRGEPPRDPSIGNENVSPEVALLVWKEEA